MSNEKNVVEKTLIKQLALLSERSEKAIDLGEIALLTQAMAKIAEVIYQL